MAFHRWWTSIGLLAGLMSEVEKGDFTLGWAGGGVKSASGAGSGGSCVGVDIVIGELVEWGVERREGGGPSSECPVISNSGAAPRA